MRISFTSTHRTGTQASTRTVMFMCVYFSLFDSIIQHKDGHHERGKEKRKKIFGNISYSLKRNGPPNTRLPNHFPAVYQYKSIDRTRHRRCCQIVNSSTVPNLALSLFLAYGE